MLEVLFGRIRFPEVEASRMPLTTRVYGPPAMGLTVSVTLVPLLRVAPDTVRFGPAALVTL